jgi:DNA-binding transcriptional MerR regulator
MSYNDDPKAPADEEAFWVDDSGVHPRPPADTVLSIDNVARMFNVSRLTLRHYEIRGLIKRRHRVGHTRVYSWADCERLACILKVRRAGIALGEVQPILAAVDDVLADRRLAQQQCVDLMARMDRRRRTFDDALAELQHLHLLLSGKPLEHDKPSGGASDER